MSIATKQPLAPQQRAPRRIWKVPASKMRWLWLVGSGLVFVGIYAWYFYAVKTQQDPQPINDPFRLFGIFSFVMVLGTAAYTLRRRFARGLPGKVQDWLWMHIWVGIITILVALLHENFTYVTHDFCQNAGCLTDTYWAGGALFGLLFLVLSGIVGRLLDIWQTRVIARDASTNGVGIVQALAERILELEYTVERLCAGKSESFKDYCLQAIEQDRATALPKQHPPLASSEQQDFQRAYDTLQTRRLLVRSLKKQERARAVIRVWRSLHIVLASIAVLIILYHGIMELLTNVFHVIQAA